MEKREYGESVVGLLGFAVAGNNRLVICRDGTAWMAHRMDFVNIMESENFGFGITIEEAVINLLAIEEEAAEKRRGKDSFVSRWKARFGIE